MNDLAEFVSVYHVSEVLKQPYRVVVAGRGGDPVLVFEPMKSARVRTRFGEMQRFYERKSTESLALP